MLRWHQIIILEISKGFYAIIFTVLHFVKIIFMIVVFGLRDCNFVLKKIYIFRNGKMEPVH